MDFDTSSLVPIDQGATTGALDLSSLTPLGASQLKPASTDRTPDIGQVGQQFSYGLLSGIPNAIESTMNAQERGRNMGVVMPGADLIAGTIAPMLPGYQDTSGPKAGGVVKQGLNAVGLNPDNLPAPQSMPERVARMGGEGTILAVAPELAVGRAAEAATLGNIFRAGFTGAASGAAGQAGVEVAPDNLKPVAGLAAGLLGGAGADIAATSLAKAGETAGRLVAPLSQSGREAAVGEKLVNAASDPTAAMAALDQPGEIVPGSAPTTFQQSGDMGLGSLERSVATQNPELFNARRAEQNSARLSALTDVQADGHPEAVSDFFRNQLSDIDQSTQAAYDNAAQQARTAAQSVGPDQTAEAGGNQLRQALQDQLDADKARERALWQTVDPEGTLNVVTSPLKRAAATLYGDANPEQNLTMMPREGQFADIIGSYGPTLPFSRLVDLRSAVSAAMREAKSPLQPNDVAYGRLSQLREAVENAISDSVQGNAAQEQQAVASGALAPEDTMAARWAQQGQESGGQGNLEQAVGSPATPFGGNAGTSAGQVGEGGNRGNVPAGTSPASGIPGNASRLPSPEPGQVARPSDQAGQVAISPSGLRVQTRPEIVDASSLQKATGDLQVRDRSRQASNDWIEKTARDLDPDQLMPSIYSDRGAPIVGADNIVDSGNGRMAAIRRAAEAYPESYAAYKDALRRAGFKVPDTGTPVLISRRTTELSPEGRVKFNADSNGSAVARMSATETAQADRAAMTDGVLRELAPGNITSAENRSFVAKFLGNLSPNEASALVDRHGNLNADGVRRIENGLVASAYGDVDHTALQKFAEATDDNTRAIVGAMSDAAGLWAQMRRDIKAGDIPAEYDVTPALTDALKSISRWRDQALREKRPVGMVIKEGMSQLDMLSGEMPAEAQMLARAFYRDDNFSRAASREAIGELLGRYVDAAHELGAPQLFGETSRPAPLEVLRNVKGKVQEQPGPSEGAVNGTEGNVEETGRPANGEAGAGNRPLIDQQTADRLATATAATKERKQTFGAKPVANILQREGTTYPYKMQPDSVLSQVWKAGGNGAAAVTSVLKAAKNAPDALDAIKGAAAASMRKAAIKDDGTVDPAKLAAWRNAHSDALKALEQASSGATAPYETAARAADHAANIAAVRHDAISSFEKSAIGKLLNVSDPADVVKTVGDLLGKKNSVQLMREVAAEAKRDPAAFEGLRRSLVEFAEQKLVSNTEAGTSGQNLIKSDAFQTFLSKNDAALRQVFTPEEMNAWRAIAQDLKRANRSVTAVKLPGQSNTAQDIALMGKHGHAIPTLLTRIFSVLGPGAGGFILTGGLEGGLTGAAAGVAASYLGNLAGAFRSAGIAKMDDLLTEAMLNPELAKTLMKKAPKRLDTGSGRTLMRVLRGLSVGLPAANDVAQSRGAAH